MLGELHIISGPMFSGKTSLLIKKIEESHEAKLIINHVFDDRYGVEQICTHDRFGVKSISLSNLRDIKSLESYSSVRHIFVDEAQFFTDLESTIHDMVNIDKKIVYVSGLTTDYLQKPFGGLVNLMCQADSISIVRGTCKRCNNKNKSLWTGKKDKTSLKVIDIGEDDKYEALCRNCIYK